MLKRVDRACLYGGVSALALLLLTMPSHAEQQLIKFRINGALSNDITNPAYGGPQTGFVRECCASYRGPGQGPYDDPVLPGGFITTYSGPGAVDDAEYATHGTAGTPIPDNIVGDAYDGYGGLGFRQGGGIVMNYGGLTVTRAVDATHGPAGEATPITTQFANGGVANAVRWVETITNNTNAPITGTMAYFNNLGSDENTRYAASSSGNAAASTGNLFLVSHQDGGFGADPVVTHIFGNNDYTKNNATMLHVNGDGFPEWRYPITLQPGESRTLILINVLTADINFNAADPSSDIALGVALANLITNNGQPISADSSTFTYFSDLSKAQLKRALNFDFVGLSVDLSRPYFIETDYALTHGPVEFDGGTFRPTAAMTFNEAMIANALGGTIDNTNGALTLGGVISGVGGMTFAGANTTTLTGANIYQGSTNVAAGSTLRAGAAGTLSSNSAFTVTGTLDLADLDQSVKGLTNGGRVLFGPGDQATTLTTKNYVGNGGTLVFSTFLGDDTSPSDRLVIDGGTATGTTFVQIVNAGGLAAQTTGNGIKIVDAINGATTSSTAFQLSNAIAIGAYDYYLYHGGLGADADDQDWYLRSTDELSPAAQAALPFADTLINYAGATLGTIGQRSGNRIWPGDGAAQGGIQPAADIVAERPVLSGTGAWARAGGQYGEYAPKNGSAYEQSIGFMQGGYEFAVLEDEASLLTFGGYVTLGTSSTRVAISDDPANGAARGHSKITTTAYGAGLTMSWLNANGFYADGIGQFTFYDNDLSNNLDGGNDAWSTILSLELGKRLQLGESLSLVPQLQLAWTHADFDDFQDNEGNNIALVDDESLRGRVGLKLEHLSDWITADGEVERAQLYGIVNLHNEFLDGTSIEMTYATPKQSDRRLWGEIGVGASYAWADRWSVYGEADYATAFSNSADNYALTGTAGVRYSW